MGFTTLPKWHLKTHFSTDWKWLEFDFVPVYKFYSVWNTVRVWIFACRFNLKFARPPVQTLQLLPSLISLISQFYSIEAFIIRHAQLSLETSIILWLSTSGRGTTHPTRKWLCSAPSPNEELESVSVARQLIRQSVLLPQLWPQNYKLFHKNIRVEQPAPIHSR